MELICLLEYSYIKFLSKTPSIVFFILSSLFMKISCYSLANLIWYIVLGYNNGNVNLEISQKNFIITCKSAFVSN